MTDDELRNILHTGLSDHERRHVVLLDKVFHNARRVVRKAERGTTEVRLNKVDGMVLCDLCLDAAGGECHVPGCIMFLNRAPDLPLREKVFLFGGQITPLVQKPARTGGER